MGGGDWGMDRGKRTYGTYGDGGSGRRENIWNVNKEYRKKERESTFIWRFSFVSLCQPTNVESKNSEG